MRKINIKLPRQVLLTIAAFLGLFVVLGGIKFFSIWRAMRNNAHVQAPESVTSMVTKIETWPSTLHAVGSLMATQGVVLAAEEPGTVSKVSFESGQSVQAGQMLVELDTSVEDAELRAAEAVLFEAEKDFARAKELRAAKANSQADFDVAEAKFRGGKAAVESLTAKIARKKIVAPFDGCAGIRMVNVGQYLPSGTTVVPLYRLDQLYLNFSVPEQDLVNMKPNLSVTFQSDALPGQTFEARLSATDPQIDPATRNAKIQATLANPEHKLRPGMYARITVNLDSSKEYIALPASSLQYAPYGTSVFVIEKMKDPANVEYMGVRQQMVKVGPKRGDLVAIIDGLKPGDEVVTSGTFKLRPGIAVAINNSFNPQNNPDPQDT